MRRAIAVCTLLFSLLGAAVAAPLSITTKSPLPGAVVGKAYSITLAAKGGVPPYKWKATGVPNGLTWTPKGVISGKPLKAGTHTIVVTVTDSARARATVAVGVE